MMAKYFFSHLTRKTAHYWRTREIEKTLKLRDRKYILSFISHASITGKGNQQTIENEQETRTNLKIIPE